MKVLRQEMLLKTQKNLKNGLLELYFSRDLLLRDFGKKTMDSLYLQPEELYQTLLERVATTYGDDPAHSQRLYDYLSRNWFMAAIPVLGNAGFIISMRVKKRWNQLNLHFSTYLFLATLMRRKILWKVYLVSWPRICF